MAGPRELAEAVELPHDAQRLPELVLGGFPLGEVLRVADDGDATNQNDSHVAELVVLVIGGARLVRELAFICLGAGTKTHDATGEQPIDDLAGNPLAAAYLMGDLRERVRPELAEESIARPHSLLAIRKVCVFGTVIDSQIRPVYAAFENRDPVFIEGLAKL
jgi:hypothetical protein